MPEWYTVSEIPRLIHNTDKLSLTSTVYKLASSVDGEQIVNVNLVEQIEICDALLSENGAFHLSQRTKCVVIPPIREILATEPYGKRCCCKNGNEDAHTQTFRPPLNTIRFAGDEPIPSNHVITDLFNQLRQLYEVNSTLMINLCDWISLRVPKIEDGNNFGVEVQEKCSQVINKAGVYLLSDTLTMEDYCKGRISLFTTYCTHPQMDDAKQQMIEYDMAQFTRLRNCLIVLRQHLLDVHLIVTKNIAKVKEPKPVNCDTFVG